MAPDKPIEEQEEDVMKMTHSLIALLLSCICVPLLAAQMKTDYDQSVNFSQYKTYSWIKVQAGDSLWADRIQQDVDVKLAAKGWTKVAANGNASISAFESTHNQMTLETFYDGFGGGWRWRGFDGGTGMSTTETDVTKVGTLVVDIFDSQSQKLIWRGNESADLSGHPDRNAKNLAKNVGNMFKHFPPSM